MSDKESKDIQLWDMEKDLLIPKPNLNRLQYYEDEIKSLNESLQNRHKEYMEMSHRLDTYRVKRLETFRKVFMLDCIVLNTDLDLIKCRDTIAEGRCLFYDKCKPRSALLEKLHLKTGDLSDPRNPRIKSPIT